MDLTRQVGGSVDVPVDVSYENAVFQSLRDGPKLALLLNNHDLCSPVDLRIASSTKHFPDRRANPNRVGMIEQLQYGILVRFGW